MRDSLVSGIVALVVAVLGTGGLVSLLNARAERRRSDADAEVSLSDGALRRLRAAEDKADSAEAKADKAIEENARLKRRQFAYETWVDQHRIWDQEAVEENHRLGGQLRPPPQLVMFRGDDEV